MTDTAIIQPIPFGTRRIGPGCPVVVIAEIGINHEGDSQTCARMIEEAWKAGADAVKLQTVDPSENYAPGTPSFEIYSKAQLTPEKTAEMFEFSKRLGLDVFTTAGDFRTLDWVDNLVPAAHKISSGLLTHIPIIEYASKTSRSVLISTGMGEPSDIDAAVTAAKKSGVSHLGLFQCTSLYPAPPETLNLATVSWLKERYHVPTGFSDHSLGTEAAALSVAAGANMIEKHFTLESSRTGYDHAVALDPSEFTEMVQQVRTVETIMGCAEKTLTETEQKNASQLRRCIVARNKILAGHIIEANDISILRTGTLEGKLPPSEYRLVIGARVKRDLEQFQPLTPDLIEKSS
tara:strand:+ start:2167 stop:3210 length:1044 start_codon:yes stop_codon:yes gene_type:complete